MKEEEKRAVSRVLSQHNPSFLLPNICSQCLLSCLLFVLGYGWKCLDFDIFLEDRQSGLPPLQRFHTAVLKVHYPRHFS